MCTSNLRNGQKNKLFFPVYISRLLMKLFTQTFGFSPVTKPAARKKAEFCAESFNPKTEVKGY